MIKLIADIGFLLCVISFLLTLPVVGAYVFCENSRLTKEHLYAFAFGGAGIVAWFLFFYGVH